MAHSGHNNIVKERIFICQNKEDVGNPLRFLLIKAGQRRLAAGHCRSGQRLQGGQSIPDFSSTPSSKTFTMANVIQELHKPTLVIAHNKTLAAQFYGEFKEMFPENAEEYFVSYND